jgi:serine/threonine protein kinase
MLPASIADFVDNLQQSGLYSTRTIQALQEEFAYAQTGEELAASLVAAGRLTRYQADSILAGKIKALVLGQYVILNQIGKGGLGRVYKAMHKTMNRVVAIKVLAPKLVQTEHAKRLFQREVLATAKLQHPNIVTAYDASTKGGRYYLVMEYVHGPNLEELVQKRGPLKPSLACEIIRQAALGLQAAHEQDMLHRDLKPANLLIQAGIARHGKSFAVKLVDFGLARLQTNNPEIGGTILLRANTVMGTPDFISPEQARNMHEVDIRSDLYSLGCTFYFLLTGRVVFPGGTAMEKLVKHSQDEPPDLQELRPDMPPDVAQVVHKLLAKDPNDRYQTPLDLVQALDALASPGPSSSAHLRSLLPGDTPGAQEDLARADVEAKIHRRSADEEEDSALDRTWPPGIALTPLPTDPDLEDAVRVIQQHKRKQRLTRLMLAGSGLLFALVILFSYLLTKLVL